MIYSDKSGLDLSDEKPSEFKNSISIESHDENIKERIIFSQSTKHENRLLQQCIFNTLQLVPRTAFL